MVRAQQTKDEELVTFWSCCVCGEHGEVRTAQDNVAEIPYAVSDDHRAATPFCKNRNPQRKSIEVSVVEKYDKRLHG